MARKDERVNGRVDRSEQAEQPAMFIEDRKHVNCAVAGAAPMEDGFIGITFQVGPTRFESFVVGQHGQKLIAEASKLAGFNAADIQIARGPLPPQGKPRR